MGSQGRAHHGDRAARSCYASTSLGRVWIAALHSLTRLGEIAASGHHHRGPDNAQRTEGQFKDERRRTLASQRYLLAIAIDPAGVQAAGMRRMAGIASEEAPKNIAHPIENVEDLKAEDQHVNARETVHQRESRTDLARRPWTEIVSTPGRNRRGGDVAAWARRRLRLADRDADEVSGFGVDAFGCLEQDLGICHVARHTPDADRVVHLGRPRESLVSLSPVRQCFQETAVGIGR